MPERARDDEIRSILQSVRTIAVLGAHEESGRAAFYVPDYLREQGYRVIPVNPYLVGKELWGEPVRRSLLDLAGVPVDLVDVFRRAPSLPGHIADIVGMRPRPRVVWFQLGIRNDAVAAELVREGFDVVQDRCTLADHRRLRIGLVG